MLENKTPKQTEAITTHLVLPNDTNIHGTLFGGRLLAWMDIIASVSARRHASCEVVTASVNNVSFNHPIKLGDTVTLIAKVSRAFNSSMEIFIDVWVEDYRKHTKTKCNEAIYTFVAINKDGKTVKIPGIIPENQEEKERYNSALRRRQLSLILGKRMKPEDATELKSLFM